MVGTVEETVFVIRCVVEIVDDGGDISWDVTLSVEMAADNDKV